MIKSKKIKKCNAINVTLGGLPSSYLQSLTYEEQLIWFCKYLEEVILPVINKNTEDIEKIKIDLSNYYTKEETYSINEINTLLNTKANISDLPTKTSELTNDSDFTTKSYVDGLIGNINSVLDTINGEVI